MPVPVMSVAQTREWEDSAWAAGVSREMVIDSAGRHVAEKVRQMVAPGDFVLILAGKGHNGDDGRAAHRHLEGVHAELVNLHSIAHDLPSALQAIGRKPRLIVDALFGVGLSRPLDEEWRKAVESVNAFGGPVLAVDVPSGLNADTGEAMGAAIEATVTLTLGAPKTGLLKTAARRFVGRIELAEDIGLPGHPAEAELNWILAEDFEGFPPPRKAFSYKGSYGHLGIIAGSQGFHGAALLAARAAQRAQPGLITLLTMPEVSPIGAGRLEAVMADEWSENHAALEKASALMVGPGLAAKSVPEPLRNWIRRQWESFPGPMVADASALDWLPQGGAENPARIITPHPGEAARMLDCTVAEVESDRPAALRKLSRDHKGCWVILKGAQTLVGRASGPIRVNSSGNPHMGQGGSGDVLAGFMAGLAAQPVLHGDWMRTVSYAAWRHGATADALTLKKRNWIVEELADEIGS